MTLSQFLAELEKLECEFELLPHARNGSAIYHTADSTSLWSPLEMVYNEKIREPREPWLRFETAYRMLGLDAKLANAIRCATMCYTPYDRKLRVKILRATGLR